MLATETDGASCLFLSSGAVLPEIMWGAVYPISGTFRLCAALSWTRCITAYQHKERIGGFIGSCINLFSHVNPVNEP